MAGLIASSGVSSNGLYKGVAPGVRLIRMRVLDQNGQGRTSDVINAITFATANKRALGIDIINLSLGHPIYEASATDPLVQAVEQATRAGIIVVTAAGNSGANLQTGRTGYAGVTSPGNARSAITVGAVDTNGTATRRDDRIAPYSSRGPTWYDGEVKPDIVAPGHRLASGHVPDDDDLQELPGPQGGRELRDAQRHEHVDRCRQRHRRADARGEPYRPTALRGRR